VSANGGDVRDVGVRGVQIGSELSNGMFPSISLRAGSAVGDTRSVGRGTSLRRALRDSAAVVDGSRSGAIVRLDALNEVELLELVGDDVESAGLDQVPVTLNSAVLATPGVAAG